MRLLHRSPLVVVFVFFFRFLHRFSSFRVLLLVTAQHNKNVSDCSTRTELYYNLISRTFHINWMIDIDFVIWAQPHPHAVPNFFNQCVQSFICIQNKKQNFFLSKNSHAPYLNRITCMALLNRWKKVNIFTSLWHKCDFFHPKSAFGDLMLRDVDFFPHFS